MRHRTLGALVWLVLLPAGLDAQHYGFKRYDQDSGLLDQNVRTLLQDRTGFLWVGTDNGLFRYDGHRFRNFTKADGLPSSQVEGLDQTSDGTLWVATLAGLAKLSGERFETVDISPGRGAVAIASDTRGRQYVGIYFGLLARGWPAGSPKVPASRLYTVPAQESQAVRSIGVAPSGSVWFGCGRQICRLDGESVIQRPEWDVPDDVWTAIRVDPQGNVWARSTTKLIELPKGEHRFLRRDAGLPPAEEGALLIGRDGQVWVPTVRGIARRTETGWDIVGKSRGLPISSVHCALEDREGSIWIGLNGGGLVRWLGFPGWESWTEAEGLSSESAWGIRRDGAGVLWSVSDTGVSRFNEARRRWEDLKARGLASVQAVALMPAPDGSLWVGHPAGVFQVDLRRGSATAYGRASGLAGPWATSIVFDSQNQVWVGTTGGLYRSVSGGSRIRFARQALPDERGADVIHAILLDRRGRMWLGSANGVLRMEAGRWRRLTTGDGLLHDQVRSLAEGADGSLWVGYAEPVGVTQLVSDGDHLRWRHFSRNDGLRSNKAYFLGCDLRGRMWCGTDQGVDVFDGTSWRHFDHTDGLAWDDCSANSFWADPDGSIWMGTTRGISHLRISDNGLPPRPTDAPALLTSAVLGDQNIGLGGGISVPWRQHSLHVGFAGMSFVNEDTMRFRYRIAGLEERWTETQLREAHVPSLPAGRYTFEVQANAARGAWNGLPARLSFVVRPAWWRTWWFDLIALTAAGLLAHQLWAWRLRSVLKRQKELEDAVADRTQSLEVEKANAVRERDTVEKQKVEIEHLFRESRQAARLKDELLANMSHEFRTPMNAVIGMTELALDTPLTAEQREYLETVLSSSGTLLGILDSILEVSNLEAGKLDLETVGFDLDEVVNGTVQKVSLRARQKHLELLLKVASNVPRRLVGDAARLEQVLFNLLSNAVKFTELGQVRLHVDLDESTETALLHFQIHDTGIGISPDKLSVIFEPFSQADGSHTRRYGGTGLGLAICTRLVEMMGGCIWVESELGKGSRFHFTARFRRQVEPARPEAPIIRHTSESLSALAAAVESKPIRIKESPGVSKNGITTRIPPPNFTPREVLLAEDNPVNQRLAVSLLQKRGHSVVTVANGAEALTALARRSFDVVLMDLQMPEMDGLEATTRIRARECQTGGRTPIIALTAHVGQTDRERCLKAGMDGYLPKPIQPADLFAAVERPRPALSTVGTPGSPLNEIAPG